MPITTRYLIHSDYELVDGKPMAALWPAHKPLAEVLDLKDTTPATIWEGTYQGNPTPPEGSIFMREWWEQKNRYGPESSYLINKVVARWISWDTGLKDAEDNAFSAAVVGELMPDYTMILREVWRDRLQFPDLPDRIKAMASKYNKDEKLRGVLIEDKASGTSAYQTLANTAEKWLKARLIPFMPTEDKVTRAQQAAVWCKNDCVLFPHPTGAVPWLMDFEDELFDFPGSVFKDQVDAFSQLIIWTENLLAQGWRARNAIA